VKGVKVRNRSAAHHVQDRPLVAQSCGNLPHARVILRRIERLARAGPSKANPVEPLAQAQEPIYRPIHVPKRRALLSKRPLWQQ
jgi:hypothetical protein